MTRSLDVIPPVAYLSCCHRAASHITCTRAKPRFKTKTTISCSKGSTSRTTKSQNHNMADKVQQPQISEQDAQNAKDPNHPAHPHHPHVSSPLDLGLVKKNTRESMLIMTSMVSGSKMRARSSATQQSLELERLLARMQSKAPWDSRRRVTFVR